MNIVNMNINKNSIKSMDDTRASTTSTMNKIISNRINKLIAMNPEILTHNFKNFSIGYSPERGGIITSIKKGDIELLYLNPDTFNDLSKNVRGGIPLLFPNAGPLRDNNKYNLAQHGFIRNSVFKLIEQDRDKILLGFNSDESTLDKYNYNFEFYLEIKEIDDKITISQIIKNTGDTPMPISPGFHPYFNIPHQVKKDIKFSFSDDNYYDIWSKGDAKELNNPGRFEVDFGGYTLEFDYGEVFKYIWLWSEPQKDYICIEPIYEQIDGLLDNPYIVEVNGEIKMSMSIGLK